MSKNKQKKLNIDEDDENLDYFDPGMDDNNDQEYWKMLNPNQAKKKHNESYFKQGKYAAKKAEELEIDEES